MLRFGGVFDCRFGARVVNTLFSAVSHAVAGINLPCVTVREVRLDSVGLPFKRLSYYDALNALCVKKCDWRAFLAVNRYGKFAV